MNNHSKRVNDYLGSSSEALKKILTKVKFLTRINELFLNCLDPEIRPYCQLANLDQKRLVIVTSSNAIAARLRFQTANLLDQLKKNQTFTGITTIQYKIVPDFKQQPERLVEKTSNLAPLSEDTVQILKEIADTIEDPLLQEKLKNMGSFKLPPK